jgi:hypothetical protein
MRTNNFTADSAVFLFNSHMHLWRFEVSYALAGRIVGVSAMNFRINEPPTNGSCSIQPINGTTTTPFQVSCFNWFDQHGIKDYALHGT